MADVKDPRRTDLGLLQQLNGQYGAEHCHVGAKHNVLRCPHGLDLTAGCR